MQLIDRLKERLREYLVERDEIARTLHPMVARFDALEVVIQEFEAVVGKLENNETRIEKLLPEVRALQQKFEESQDEDDLVDETEIDAPARGRFAELGAAIVGPVRMPTRIIAGVISTMTGEFTIKDLEESCPPKVASRQTVMDVIMKLIRMGRVERLSSAGGKGRPAVYKFIQQQQAA